jgi:hypothetical protein
MARVTLSEITMDIENRLCSIEEILKEKKEMNKSIKSFKSFLSSQELARMWSILATQDSDSKKTLID